MVSEGPRLLGTAIFGGLSSLLQLSLLPIDTENQLNRND